ncbi:MAG TPA: hypothetical protein VFZ09_27595 [Archangium sp.]|uniref:hypothetical protein n=1 Tax=Archangium sp. TaxID=1872627 RepID=UPI002E2ECBEF|nr:hypothetical protein [Archangium sp.]HEX5750025.1 hypothetical protein [Archangium sp.]
MPTDAFNSPPRLYKTVTINIGGTPVTLALRRISPSLAAMVMAEAQKAGDADKDNKPIGLDGGMRVMARMAACVIYLPDAVRPRFNRRNPEDLETIIESDWLMDLQDDINGAMAHSGVALEHIKGNSEATQTEPSKSGSPD